MRQRNDSQEKSLSIPAWDEKALTFRGSTQIPRSFLQEHMQTSMLIVRVRRSLLIVSLSRRVPLCVMLAGTGWRGVSISLLVGTLSAALQDALERRRFLSVYLRGGTWLACLPFLFICSIGRNPYSSRLFVLMIFVIRSMKSGSGVAPRFSLVRRRTATALLAASLSPTTSMYGIFWSCASRTLAFIRSLRVSASARTPAALSASRTLMAYSWWRSAMGIIMACTGASQTGNAPA